MTNSLLAVMIVLAMVGAFAWFLRSGRFGALSAKASAISIETAASLGERRQLVIVGVEGRRFLLGVTQAGVALVTELQPASLQPVPPVPEAPRS
jgi:flagellar biogenesis protein FliO